MEASIPMRSFLLTMTALFVLGIVVPGCSNSGPSATLTSITKRTDKPNTACSQAKYP